jgi:hypothetical protein
MAFMPDHIMDEIIEFGAELDELVNEAGNPDFRLIQKNPILAGKPTHVIKGPNLKKPMYNYNYDGYVRGVWTKYGQRSDLKYEYNPISESEDIPWFAEIVEYFNDRTFIGNPYSYINVKVGDKIIVPDGDNWRQVQFIPDLEDLEFIIEQKNRPETDPEFEDEIELNRTALYRKAGKANNIIDNIKNNKIFIILILIVIVGIYIIYK